MYRSMLITEIQTWLAKKQHLVIAMTLLLFLASSIGVIYSAHMTRQMYATLQTLQRQQDDLDNEYEKLLLEQSAWANYTRVDQLAREELNMAAPRARDVVVVKGDIAFNNGTSQ